MADDQAYVDTLAGQLCTRHTALVRNLEDEMKDARIFKATVARFVNNPAIALDIRQGLARDLGIPEPR
jgi:hypothetical protein